MWFGKISIKCFDGCGLTRQALTGMVGVALQDKHQLDMTCIHVRLEGWVGEACFLVPYILMLFGRQLVNIMGP